MYTNSITILNCFEKRKKLFSFEGFFPLYLEISLFFSVF